MSLTALERIARMEAEIAFLSTTLQALEAPRRQLESAPVAAMTCTVTLHSM